MAVQCHARIVAHASNLHAGPFGPGAVSTISRAVRDAIKVGILNGMNGSGACFVGKDSGFTRVADIRGGYETSDQFTAWFWTGAGSIS